MLTLDVVGAGITELGPDCLLVFADETGCEDRADTNHPVYGLGACAVPVRTYVEGVVQPWRQLKATHLGNPQAPIHAHAVDRRDGELLAALDNFFRSGAFIRVGVVTSVSATWPSQDFVVPQMGRRMLDETIRLSRETVVNEVAVILESNPRTNAALVPTIRGYPIRGEFRGIPFRTTVKAYWGPKTLGADGLEVADFIANAVGGWGRDVANGRVGSKRKDHAAVFQSNLSRSACEYVKTVFKVDDVGAHHGDSTGG